MDYKESECIKSLKATIDQLNASKKEWPKKAEDANKFWNASLLFCKIVLGSKASKLLFTRTDFEKFKVRYEQQNSVSIDSVTLFERFWLREVLGFVHIPDAVRVVTNDYEKYRDYHNEILFLRMLYKNYPNQKISENNFNQEFNTYERNNEITLLRKWFEKTQWVKPSKEKDELKIGNVDYLLNLLDNWESFAFLLAFKLKNYERQKYTFEISSKALNSILTKHWSYFPLTPSLSEFEDNGTFVKNKNVYLFRTTQNEIDFWHDLKNQIGGHYWEALLQDNNFKTHRERLINFIDVMLRGARWPNVDNYISVTSKADLLSASIQLIKKEPDISGIEDEFAKCYLDQQLGSHYGFQSNQPLPDDYLDDTNNILERYKQLQYISSKYQNNIFYVQESRSYLAFLVRMVVLFDKEYDTTDDNGKSKQVHFYNVKELLRSGLEKPYLVWEVAHFIKQNRPEIIPYLLIESDLSAFGFHLLNQIKTEVSNRNVRRLLRQQSLEKGLELLLNSYLRKQKVGKNETAQLVFLLFQEITKEKSNSVSRVQLAEERRLLLEERKEKERKLLDIIENCELNGGFVEGTSGQALLFHIFDELVDVIEQHHIKQKYLNGVIQLPFLQLDALCWLSQFLLYTDFNLPKERMTKLKSKVTTTFINIYRKKIELKTVMRKDFDSAEKLEAIPNWPDQNEALARIDWLSPILIAYETGDLNEFLNPRFKLEDTKEAYNKENNFQADKIRTHLFVLLSILMAIQHQESYLIKEFSIEVKQTVENTIVSLLKKYGQGNLSHSINIIDQHHDRQHFRSIESELLPFIIEMGDLFENKSVLFNQLVNTKNVVQLLYVFSHSQTEGVKESVINQIRGIDIQQFMDEQFWLPEITFVVTELSKIPELQNEAAAVLNTWETLTSKRKVQRETVKDIFEAQLMQAYYEGDESKVQSIDEPESGYVIQNEFKPADHKQFFIGLIRYKDKPENAYQIFDKLVKRYPKYATFALNRFGAKVNLALKNNSKESFKEGLKEWLSYEKMCLPTILNTVLKKVNYNKLTVYLNLDDTDAFNELYEKLSIIHKLAPDIVELRVQMLVKNEFVNEARVLVSRALSFHSALNQNNFQFLKDLENKISESNTLEEIKTYISGLRTNAKNSVSSLKPLKYEDNFGKSIANEIVTASKRFLKNVKLYSPNADEDDYSLFIKEILENKLTTFGLHIEDQSKGGSSFSGKKAGERDMVICDDSGDISVIEAFKHSTKTVVQKHITKIFNYTHMRNVFFILAYDLKSSETFDNRWKYYKSKTLKSIVYPEGYEIDVNSIWDATEDLMVKNSAIKVCRTIHKSGTEIFHIMLNVNYFI
ncbi:MAG: hypothetical protein QM499_04830 [Flavobacteriaceae bacterium]